MKTAADLYSTKYKGVPISNDQLKGHKGLGHFCICIEPHESIGGFYFRVKSEEYTALLLAADRAQQANLSRYGSSKVLYISRWHSEACEKGSFLRNRDGSAC